MPRWFRVIRGMLGMGLTFSVGVGVVASVIALIPLLLSQASPLELLIPVVGSALWAFPIGVAFSAAMALTAGGRTFEKLSLPRFAAMGAGAGLLAFGLLSVNAWDAWTVSAAIGNAAILIGLGGTSATVSLLLARRARPALEPGDGSQRLEGGQPAPTSTGK